MKPKKNTSPEQLVLKLLESHTLITCQDSEYIVITNDNDQTCVYTLHEQRLLDWISLKIYNKHAVMVKEQQIAAALSIARSKARIHGQRKIVHTRFALHNGSYFLDLCGGKNQSIQIDDSGWEIVQNPDVLFYRPMNMEAIPSPERTSTPAFNLFNHINVFDQLDRISLLAWITSLVRVDIQRPILTLRGCSKII